MLSSTKSSPMQSRRTTGLATTRTQQPPEGAPNEAPTRASNFMQLERCVHNGSDARGLLLEEDLSDFSLKLQMTGLVDTADITALTLLLARTDVQLNTLDLNLSSGTNPVELGALLATLRKHPELQFLRFRVDGSEKGPFPSVLREVLASSKECLIKGGVALREALFRELDRNLNRLFRDIKDLWEVAGLLSDFRSMRLDDALIGLRETNAQSLTAANYRLRDEALRLAIAALRS